MNFKIVLNFLFFTLFYFSFNSVFSQQDFNVKIDWETPKEVVISGAKIKIPSIKDQNFDFNKPNFYWIQKVSVSDKSTISLIDFETEDALLEEIDWHSKNNILQENVMSIFDDMNKFIKEVVEKVEDTVEDIFDGDNNEESDAE